MTTPEIIAQITSVLAVGFNCLSFLQKKKSTLLVLQLGSSVLFAATYFLLGAIAGAIINIVSIFRAIIFLWKDKLHADNALWTGGFILAYIASYASTFLIFQKEASLENLIIEFLPVIAMTAMHLSLRYSDTKMVRRFGLVSSPTWLAYNIAIFSIGGTVSELLNFASIIIGIFRFDITKKNNG